MAANEYDSELEFLFELLIDYWNLHHTLNTFSSDIHNFSKFRHRRLCFLSLVEQSQQHLLLIDQKLVRFKDTQPFSLAFSSAKDIINNALKRNLPCMLQW